MATFETLYEKRDNTAFVSAHLSRYLIGEIYSVPVIRLAYARWQEIPFYARESVHLEIRKLIDKAPNLSNAEIQKEINTHWVIRAVKTLLKYSHCPVPLTDDKSIPVKHQNFLSDRGKWAMKALLKAAVHGHLSHEMADLAVRTSHKFLMDLGYYRNLIKSSSADILTFDYHDSKKGLHNYIPPIIQLVQGCPNHCSHCFAGAEAHLSYMPYPMWRKIYETLQMRYQYYHGQRLEYQTPKLISWLPWIPKGLTWNYPPMDRFFHDSDISVYHDPIINADSGDIALLLNEKNEDLYFLTKGITNPVSRRAIAKTALAYPIDISFVDTPKESRVHSIRQLKNTIHLIHSVHNNNGIGRIWHYHLKSGTTFSEEIFLGEHVVRGLIHPSGRANQFAPEELDMGRPNAIYPFAINPNGDVVLPKCENTRYIQDRVNNIFRGPRERE